MEFLLETIRLGLTNLRLNLLRSILTALGIIFGVAAVIAMVGIGEGSTREALAQIERLGARNIIIRSQKPPEAQTQQGGNQRSFLNRYGITFADLRVIEENFPDAAQVVPLKEVGSEILREQMRKISQAFGTTPEFAEVARLRVARGRYLTETDIIAQSLVCVIGSEIAKEFFRLEDPLGQTIRIDDKVLEVVGVLSPIGLSGGAGSALVGRDLNLDVHIPISTARAVFGDAVIRRTQGSFQGNEVQIAEIYLESPERERVITDAARLRRIMETRHPELTDVGMIVPYELLENARKRALTGQWISASIAAISLLVGGIGIMNIMLVSVTERTREIGIRLAIGALEGQVLAQFLAEAIVLSLFGGLIGVIMGLSLAWLGTAVLKLPFTIDPSIILLAFAFSALVGIVFGYFPARRAAQLNPIEALRHE